MASACSSMWLWALLLLLNACVPFGAQGVMPRRKYLCPPGFVRHGNSCYFFSVHMATWFDAHFACKDRNSELAILEKGWEDRNMRTYLNKPELARLERWIGGIYNWEIKRWVWGANGGNPLKYQGFSQMAKDSEPKWNCIIMDPSMNYKWSSRVCLDNKHYICEVPLKRLKPPQPHATHPQKPQKIKDPAKKKKPRNPAKRPKDPNRKQRDPNKRQRQQRPGWRQRQRARQQQRMNTKEQAVYSTPAYDNQQQQTYTKQQPVYSTPAYDNQQEHVNTKQQPVHSTPAYDNQPTSKSQYQPQSGHRTWGWQHRYRYLHLQPELIPYREEVLI